MFSHARPLGFLALSATLLVQPGAGSRAACPEDAPRAELTDVDAFIGTHFKIPPPIVLGASLPVVGEGVGDRHERYSIHIAFRGSDIARYADYALSPELAHLIHITHGTVPEHPDDLPDFMHR